MCRQCTIILPKKAKKHTTPFSNRIRTKLYEALLCFQNLFFVCSSEIVFWFLISIERGRTSERSCQTTRAHAESGGTLQACLVEVSLPPAIEKNSWHFKKELGQGCKAPQQINFEVFVWVTFLACSGFWFFLAYLLSIKGFKESDR